MKKIYLISPIFSKYKVKCYKQLLPKCFGYKQIGDQTPCLEGDQFNNVKNLDV